MSEADRKRTGWFIPGTEYTPTRRTGPASYASYRADLIDTYWRRRTDGWIAGVFCTTDRGEGVELVYNDGQDSSGLQLPRRILLEAFDRVRQQTCHRCHATAWSFMDKPGRHYVRHGCAEKRRAYLANKRGQAREHARLSVRRGWWLHPFAKVLARRSRKLLGLAGERRTCLAMGRMDPEHQRHLNAGQWLLGAMYAMRANGEPADTIGHEVGIMPQEVAMCLDWIDRVAALHARALFGPPN